MVLAGAWVGSGGGGSAMPTGLGWGGCFCSRSPQHSRVGGVFGPQQYLAVNLASHVHGISPKSEQFEQEISEAECSGF